MPISCAQCLACPPHTPALASLISCIHMPISITCICQWPIGLRLCAVFRTPHQTVLRLCRTSKNSRYPAGTMIRRMHLSVRFYLDKLKARAPCPPIKFLKWATPMSDRSDHSPKTYRLYNLQNEPRLWTATSLIKNLNTAWRTMWN